MSSAVELQRVLEFAVDRTESMTAAELPPYSVCLKPPETGECASQISDRETWNVRTTKWNRNKNSFKTVFVSVSFRCADSFTFLMFFCAFRPTYLFDHHKRSPGFPVDNACGHRRLRHWMSRLRHYTTVYCRRPSVSRRRGTNMEQFASRSDVIKFPANLQNQTKITFMPSFN